MTALSPLKVLPTVCALGRARRRRLAWNAALVACAMSAGCAGPKRVPDGFDLRNAVVRAPADVPMPAGEGGHSGRNMATAIGVGGGLGFGVGVASCLATGPFFALCLAAVVPTTTAVGAFSGVVSAGVGALTEAEREAQAASWRQAGVLPPSLHDDLAHALRQQLVVQGQVTLASTATAPVPASPAWTVHVVVSGFVGAVPGPDKPHALQMSSRLTVSPPGGATPVAFRSFVATSQEQMSLADWRAEEGQAARRAVTALVQTLSIEMARALLAEQARPPPAR